jgi:hypothetical protein
MCVICIFLGEELASDADTEPDFYAKETDEFFIDVSEEDE